MSNFLKIYQMGTDLFNTDRQTDRQADVTAIVAALSDIAKAPKKWHCHKNLRKTKSLKEM